VSRAVRATGPEEDLMYIGIGTLVLILLIVALVWFFSRRTI
jgi:hypothetical protein